MSDFYIRPALAPDRRMTYALFAFDTAAALPYLPYVIGSGVVTVVCVALFTRRHADPELTRRPPPDARTGAAPGNWESTETEQNIADRRGSVRRDGGPVKVLVSAAGYKREMTTGWVLDRSTGGLRLAVRVPIPAGTSVQVMAQNAPDTTPWTTLVVRSSQPMDGHHELGCEFEQTPPWNVLLLFG